MTKTADRKDHLAWCKARATEYVQAGDLLGALASMVSDMNKHPETNVDPALMMLGMMEMDRGSAAVQRFIDGFN